MKTKKLIFLFSILFSMLVTNASAKDNYDIALKNADGVMIYYAYNNKETEVVVTYKTDSHNSYSGSVVIPKEITYNKKRLKVTGIASEAFKDCSNLKSVTIPDCVKCINFYAFEGCSKLTSITINNGVTEIKDDAFRDCSSLASITIPNSVTKIGKKFSKAVRA